MKIQYFAGAAEPPVTGGEIYHAELLGFLSARHDVIREAGIAAADGGTLLSANLWSWRRMRAVRADVIVQDAYYAACLCLSNWLVRPRGARIVVCVQEVLPAEGWRSPLPRAIHDLTLALLLRSATVVVANSAHTRRQVIARYRLDASRVVVVAPGGGRLPPPARLRPASNAEKHVLCVANIRPGKGQVLLVQAMARIPAASWRLILAGAVKDNQYHDELMRLIAQTGIGDRVEMPGFLGGEHLAREYQRADLFVLPTRSEGYGMVIAEAMRWSLPIIATTVGAVPELLEHGRTGWLIPPDDPSALADAIQALLTDEELRARLARAAGEASQRLPTWEEQGRLFAAWLQPGSGAVVG